jgi:1,4-dihydroxy-2-naphthoyl-CoA synthase
MTTEETTSPSRDPAGDNQEQSDAVAGVHQFAGGTTRRAAETEGAQEGRGARVENRAPEFSRILGRP